MLKMQNQKTEPKTELDELPALNAEEMTLVEALGQGDDNVQAYRRAYEAEGYRLPELRVRACRKVAEPKIQLHLRHLRAVGFANAKLTLESRLMDELAFAQRAEDAGNYGAAGGSHDRINKLMGLYVERLEVMQADPLDALRQIALSSPALAAQLAKDNGIAWDEETHH